MYHDIYIVLIVLAVNVLKKNIISMVYVHNDIILVHIHNNGLVICNLSAVDPEVRLYLESTDPESVVWSVFSFRDQRHRDFMRGVCWAPGGLALLTPVPSPSNNASSQKWA